MKLSHMALLALAILVSGLMVLANKVGVDQFEPLFFATGRFALVTLCLVPFIRWVSGRMREILLIAIVNGVLHFGLLFLGFRLAQGLAGVAVAAQLYAPFGALFAAIFLRERIGWPRLSGLLLAFAGVVVIGFEPTMFARPWALVLVVAGAFALGVGIVIVSRTHGVSVFTLQGWLGLIAAPILLLLSLGFEAGQLEAIREATAFQWGALAYTALGGTIIGHGAWYYLQRMYPVSVISPPFLIGTLIAVSTGVIFYDDVLTARFLLGAAMTLGGTAIILSGVGRAHPQPAAKPA